MAASNWWEPGTSDLFDVGDLSALLGLIALAAGMVFGVSMKVATKIGKFKKHVQIKSALVMQKLQTK
jgi:hypothetical protein